MTDRRDIDRLTAANQRLVEMARADLVELTARIDLSDIATARAALLEIVPELVREYGELAAIAAADWYEEVRIAAGVTSAHATALSAGAEVAAVQGSVRWAMTQADALALLQGAIQRHIWYSSRDTIARNIAGDRSKPRYARVPSGAKTCAWCDMLASRGFVYHSKKSAGGRGVGDDFHDNCSCSVVVSWDAEGIDGYDPEAMYDRYQAGRDAAGSDSPKDIAAAMRRLYPDQYTDGVQPKVD